MSLKILLCGYSPNFGLREMKSAKVDEVSLRWLSLHDLRIAQHFPEVHEDCPEGRSVFGVVRALVVCDSDHSWSRGVGNLKRQLAGCSYYPRFKDVVSWPLLLWIGLNLSEGFRDQMVDSPLHSASLVLDADYRSRIVLQRIKMGKIFDGFLIRLLNISKSRDSFWFSLHRIHNWRVAKLRLLSEELGKVLALAVIERP